MVLFLTIRFEVTTYGSLEMRKYMASPYFVSEIVI